MMIAAEVLAFLGAAVLCLDEYRAAASGLDSGGLPASASCADAASAPSPSPAPACPSSLPKLIHPCLLVEKSAHRLTLMDGPKVIKTYAVITGEHPGDKRYEGDRRTPEGTFFICTKNPESLYVLSLGLSYPNQEDAARGLADGLITLDQYHAIVAADREGGQADWYTPLGGEIMIHGCKGNRSFTAGCVAMDDSDIRELYPALPVGTRVEIRP